MVDFMSNRSPKQCVLQQFVLAKTLHLSMDRTHMPRVIEVLELQLCSVTPICEMKLTLNCCFFVLSALDISVQNAD